MGINDDPFKVDLKTGSNLEKEEKETAEVFANQENGDTASEKSDAQLTKKELRTKRRREKERVRAEERKFEREAGMLKTKRMSLTFGIVGIVASLVPLFTYVGATLLLVICGLATTAMILLFLVGLIVIAPFYLSSGKSLSDYFAVATAPAEFASGIINALSGLSGLFLTVASSIGLGLEIAALALFLSSKKALCKRNKIKRAILIAVGMLISITVLIVGVSKL